MENETLKRAKVSIGISPSNNISRSFEMISDALEELQQYRTIGTIEEFKALKEKSMAKKPIRKPNLDWTNEEVTCPSCDRNVSEFRNKYCDCGQKLDWGEEE